MNTRVRPLNPTKIHIMVYENGATLEEVATEYGMTVDEFCRKARTVVGVKKFEAVKRVCSKNQKVKKKAQEKLEQKDKNKKMPEALPREESLEEKEEKWQRALRQAQAMVKKEYEQIREIFHLYQSKKIEHEKAEREFIIAKDAFQQAEKNLQAAQKAYEEVQKEKSKHEENFLMWSKRRKNIQAKVDEFHKEDIYLIAPNYIGELPRVGRVISTQIINGIDVEIDQGSILIEEPICVTNNANYRSAVEFAKLVLKYYLGDEADKITILVNDDQFKQILKLQGIEI